MGLICYNVYDGYWVYRPITGHLMKKGVSMTTRRSRPYRAYAVEVHIGSYTFAKEFSEEQTARRCFDRMVADPPGVNQLRLWHQREMIDFLTIFSLTATELENAENQEK